MKKLLTLILIFNFISLANAVKVKSNSRYQIIIEIYEWDSECAHKGSNAASKALQSG